MAPSTAHADLMRSRSSGHNAPMGHGDAGLEYGTLEVAGVRRGYWLARGPDGPSGTLLGSAATRFPSAWHPRPGIRR
jgi:hypothetical protein